MAFSRLRATLSDIKNNDTVQKIASYLPPLNFITIHYAYFILTCLLFSVIFYGSSDPKWSISYTDSLFLVISAMTEAGLNTVNLSTMTTFQQILLWLLIVIGSAIFVSISTVLTRKRVFEQRFEHVVKRQREGRRERRRSFSRSRERPVITRLQEQQKAEEPVDRSEFESRHSGPRDPTPSPLGGDLAADKQPNLGEKGQATKQPDQVESPVDEGVRDRRGSIPHSPVLQFAPEPHTEHRVLSFVGVGAHPNSTGTSSYARSGMGGLASRVPISRIGKEDGNGKGGPGGDGKLEHGHYPTYLTRHTTGRNAQFYGLSRAEREHLGGVEYRAITLLAYVVPAYFVLWQLLGCLGLAAYMAHHKADVARSNGINPWWLGIFNGVSAFNNSGMSLLDANMIPFQSSIYTLITMGLLILAGNTAYPLFLRLILWSMLKILCVLYPDSKVYEEHKATLRFILAYPRRVYTNLFPSQPTWWLLFMVIVLNGVDWAAFELLNIGNNLVSSIPAHFRVLDGLFQALAVRSGGFYVIAIPSLRIGLQVLYVIMMYISVYPVVITMRHSNVYEERSLGIYADDTSDEEKELPKLGTMIGTLKRTLTNMTPFPISPSANAAAGTQFVRQQIRSQLSHDLWWLVLAILFISCIEVSNFERDPVTYSVFNIAFEVVSGYGCVGISTGLPNEAYSFSGGWHKASKLILCAVMLRGRHRGLPVALDRAVRLPGGGGEEEEEDLRVRRSRSMRRGSVSVTV